MKTKRLIFILGLLVLAALGAYPLVGVPVPFRNGSFYGYCSGTSACTLAFIRVDAPYRRFALQWWQFTQEDIAESSRVNVFYTWSFDTLKWHEEPETLKAGCITHLLAGEPPVVDTNQYTVEFYPDLCRYLLVFFQGMDEANSDATRIERVLFVGDEER